MLYVVLKIDRPVPGESGVAQEATGLKKIGGKKEVSRPTIAARHHHLHLSFDFDQPHPLQKQ
jgi:hypothetical protein